MPNHIAIESKTMRIHADDVPFLIGKGERRREDEGNEEESGGYVACTSRARFMQVLLNVARRRVAREREHEERVTGKDKRTTVV